MTRFSIYSLIGLALLLQLTLLNYLKLFGSKPDLILILVVFFGLFLGPSAGIETGLAAGFLEDIFVTDIFGINALALGLAGLIAGLISTKVYREAGATQFFLLILFSVFTMSVHFAAAGLADGNATPGFFEYLVTSIFPAALYTASVGLLIFLKLIGRYRLREYEVL